jgi:glycosyltransferase involved in cell wall biosynthesis
MIDGVPVNRGLVLNVDIGTLRRGRADLFVASLWHGPANLIRLAWVMAAFRPDTVNLHFPDAQIGPVLLLRRFFSFRLVVSLHGGDVERWLTDGRSSASWGCLERLRRVLRAADAVTACSRYLLRRAALVEPSIHGKSYAIHNGIDLKQFTGVDKYAHPRPYLLAYGRLTYKKGFDLLLGAFSDAALRYPDLDLILAGDGEERRALEELCKELGLNSRVVFYGRANVAEVALLLRGCRVVVVPSRQEPFGLVALETLACGRPLVATRVGGLPEIVEAVPGALVTFAEPEAADLGRAIVSALQVKAAEPRALDRFSRHRMADAYERVLQPCPIVSH